MSSSGGSDSKDSSGSSIIRSITSGSGSNSGSRSQLLWRRNARLLRCMTVRLWVSNGGKPFKHPSKETTLIGCGAKTRTKTLPPPPHHHLFLLSRLLLLIFFGFAEGSDAEA